MFKRIFKTLESLQGPTEFYIIYLRESSKCFKRVSGESLDAHPVKLYIEGIIQENNIMMLMVVVVMMMMMMMVMVMVL